MENQDLREKLEIIETYQLGSSSEFSNDSTTEYKKSSTNEEILRRDIASEILQLRKDKRKLNERIKQLEIDNLNLQSKLNPNFTHAEPTRTHLSVAPQSQGVRNRQIIKNFNLNETRQTQLQNNLQHSHKKQNQYSFYNQGCISPSPFSITNSQNGISNALEDITNQQEGYANNNNNNSQLISSNQGCKNTDTSTEQKTRFVRREQSNQSSKKYLRENSTKVSLGINNSYLGHLQPQNQIILQQQNQSNSTTPTNSYKESNSIFQNNTPQLPPTQTNNSIYIQTQIPTSSNAVSIAENDCPQKSSNIYQFKRQYPREPQPINLANSHLYSITNVQTTTSVSSSFNVPKTGFVLREAKQEEFQNSQQMQYQQQQMNFNKSVNTSSLNTNPCSSSSSSNGHYLMMSNSNNNGRVVTNQYDQKSPNKMSKASDTNSNWRSKTTPKNIKQRSMTGSKKPPRTQEDGSRWCKTPIQQRPELPSLNTNINNI